MDSARFDPTHFRAESGASSMVNFEQNSSSGRKHRLHPFDGDPSLSLVFGSGQAPAYDWERMSEQRWDPSTYPDILPSVASSTSVHSGRRNHLAPPVHVQEDLRTGDVSYSVPANVYNVR
jgi:hypothetical protein